MVYNDPQGTNEGASNWVTATGTPAPLSSDATLSALAITPSSVTLVPTFAGATESYTASADHAVASVQVTPTVNQSQTPR